MTNVERFTGGRSLMMAAALVGAVGLLLTALGAFLPEPSGEQGPRFSPSAVHALGQENAIVGHEPAVEPDPARADTEHGHALPPTHLQVALGGYLVAFAYWLGLSVGALIWLGVFLAAHARWMVVMRRPLEVMGACAPVFILLFIPIALGLKHLFMWTDPDLARFGFGAEALELIDHKRPWLNVTFFFIRTGFYFFVWSVVGTLLYRWSTRQDTVGGTALTVSQRKLGAGALPFLGISITFAAFDWLMSLNPFWISTIFGAYYFAGSFLAAMAMLTLLTVRATGQNMWGTLVTQHHLHNLGKLMFAFTIFWAYIAFSQFMLIWIANLPEEGPWYLIRMYGSWQPISILLLVGQFIAPFFFLLPRDAKLRPRGLTIAAVWILFVHFVDLYWLTMPTFFPNGFQLHWTAVTAFLGVGGIAVAFALALARGNFSVPVKDPYLDDSLRYVQP
jgi:hypothetical protein